MDYSSGRCLAALQRHDTPTVCNVIELFDVRPRSEGFTDSSVRALYPHLPPIVGYATTATFESATAPRDGDAYAGLPKQLERLQELPEPRIVVFQDLDEPSSGATYGEVMCTTYQAFGCVGLITSGTSRDVEQVERLGFPCFSTGVVASHSYCRIVDVHTPVTVGGLTVEPGDLLHADANGVASIPKAILKEVAVGCDLVVEAERTVLDYVKSGAATADGFRDAQERMRDAFAAIPARAREILAG